MKKIVVAGALCLSVGAFAIVRSHLNGVPGTPLRGHHLRAWHESEPQQSGDASGMAKHLAAAFVKVSAFDNNKDGKFDASEKEAFAQAMTKGDVQFPAEHMPPPSLTQDPEKFAIHVAEVYSRVAAFDTDKNGLLDETEEAALGKALETGKLELHPARH